MAAETNLVRGTFRTDPISALGLPPPVSIDASATVGAALKAVQDEGQGYVLVTDRGAPVGVMTEREVLMRVVARDVKYDANVRDFMSAIPHTLRDSDPIARAVKLMSDAGVDDIPIVDDSGKAVAVLRTMDIIHFLAEAFPEQVLNLPPRPHQTMPRAEGG